MVPDPASQTYETLQSCVLLHGLAENDYGRVLAKIKVRLEIVQNPVVENKEILRRK
jgi:hypothetical protein